MSEDINVLERPQTQTDINSSQNRTKDAEAKASADYLKNMFKNGHNRAVTDKMVRNAPYYDEAVQRPDEDLVPEQLRADNSSMPLDTFSSRDSTEAAGLYDESGGPLGGTEEELDSLESGGTPVDRNPRMKG